MAQSCFCSKRKGRSWNENEVTWTWKRKTEASRKLIEKWKRSSKQEAKPCPNHREASIKSWIENWG